jgi:hypothetical protein
MYPQFVSNMFIVSHCVSLHPFSTFFYSPWPSGPSVAPSSFIILSVLVSPVIWHSASVTKGLWISCWKWKSSLLRRRSSLVEHRSVLNKPKMECKQSSNRKIELVTAKFICASNAHSFCYPLANIRSAVHTDFLVRFCGSLILVCHIKYLWKPYAGFISLPPQGQFWPWDPSNLISLGIGGSFTEGRVTRA